MQLAETNRLTLRYKIPLFVLDWIEYFVFDSKCCRLMIRFMTKVIQVSNVAPGPLVQYHLVYQILIFFILTILSLEMWYSRFRKYENFVSVDVLFKKKKNQVPIHLTFYTFKKSCSGKGFIVPSGKQKIRILILLKTNVVALQ